MSYWSLGALFRLAMAAALFAVISAQSCRVWPSSCILSSGTPVELSLAENQFAYFNFTVSMAVPRWKHSGICSIFCFCLLLEYLLSSLMSLWPISVLILIVAVAQLKPRECHIDRYFWRPRFIHFIKVFALKSLLDGLTLITGCFLSASMMPTRTNYNFSSARNGNDIISIVRAYALLILQFCVISCCACSPNHL